MKWKQAIVNGQPQSHGMQSGEYRVARNYIDGCTLYVLYHGDTLLKHCNDFDECKEIAEQHAGINAEVSGAGTASAGLPG